MSSLLISGYLRELYHQFIASSYTNVPLEIIELCSMYFKISTDILLLLSDRGLYIADIANNKMWLTDVHELKTKKKKKSKKKKIITSSYWQLNNSAICYAKNFIISQWIKDKMKHIYHEKNNKFNVIFKYFHKPNHCNAFLFDANQNNIHFKQKISIFNWRLPSLPDIYENSLIYHRKYGLLSIGGRLQFKTNKQNFILNVNDNKNNKQWICDQHILSNSLHQIVSTKCILNNDESKLFLVGGIKNDFKWNALSMYDFNAIKWRKLRNMKQNRSWCGAFFDKIQNRIYVGGGQGLVYANNSVEYYDIYKNEWYSVCNTKYKHMNYPQIWINGNLFYIASTSSDFIECIDIRMNANVSNIKLTNVFDLKLKIKDAWDNDLYCLLK